MNHEIILREDEIFDVSLATFYVFDKERAGVSGTSGRLLKITGCCEFACLAGHRVRKQCLFVPCAASG